MKFWTRLLESVPGGQIVDRPDGQPHVDHALFGFVLLGRHGTCFGVEQDQRRDRTEATLQSGLYAISQITPLGSAKWAW